MNELEWQRTLLKGWCGQVKALKRQAFTDDTAPPEYKSAYMELMTFMQIVLEKKSDEVVESLLREKHADLDERLDEVYEEVKNKNG